MTLDFVKPRKKGKYYITHTSQPISQLFSDVSLQNNPVCLENGEWKASIFVDINTELCNFLDNFDAKTKTELLKHSKDWFNVDISEDEINTMYLASFCRQTNTFKTYITHDTTIYFNEHQSDVETLVKKMKEKNSRGKYRFDITLTSSSLYIFSTKSYNKWVIRDIQVSENSEAIGENKEEIELFWKELVDECIEDVLTKRINLIQNSICSLQSQYSELVKVDRMNEEWEEKISNLKKSIQNIIF